MNKQINKTSLNLSKATERGIMHRDYIAHFLRWSHIIKQIKGSPSKKINLLDIGCGNDIPLLKMLYTNKKLGNVNYCGIDILDIKINFNFGKYKDKYKIKKMNVINRIPKLKNKEWDIIVCFEVLEHNTKENTMKILENIKKVMGNKTKLFISTPCFNGSKAGNHIYEWGYTELKDKLEEMFWIDKHYGTFISQRDIEPHMKQEHKQVYNELKEYYDCNFLAVFLAPLYPQYARNVLWRCNKKINRGLI